MAGPPPAATGLSRHHERLFASELAGLRRVDGNAWGHVAVQGVPTALQRAELCGRVAEAGKQGDLCAWFRIDDGSGLARCVLWSPEPTGACAEEAADVAGAVADEVWRETVARYANEARLGALVRVQGVVSEYRGETQLTVESLQAVQDPNAEVLHWLDVCARRKERGAGAAAEAGAAPVAEAEDEEETLAGVNVTVEEWRRRDGKAPRLAPGHG